MRLPSASAIRGALWLAISLLGITVYASRSFPLSELRGSFLAKSETLMPGRIEPGVQQELASEFGGTISEVRVKPGDTVEAGDTVVIIENTEITEQVDSARARVVAATAHVKAAGATDTRAQSEELAAEQKRAAVRSQEMAQERLRAFRLSDAEVSVDQARRRTKEIRMLMQDGLATEGELESQTVRQEGAVRDLEAAREHLSRLRQEVEQADSQLRQIELQVKQATPDTASAEADLADARAALAIVEGRERGLKVVATHRGSVLTVTPSVGERVTPGSVLVRIADLSTLTISAPVTAALAGDIAVGRNVAVILPGKQTKIATQVSEVALTQTGGQPGYVIRAMIPNPIAKGLMVGLEAQLVLTH